MTAATTVNRGGRPRDPGRDDVIIAAVVELLTRGGLPAVSMDRVAIVAGVGKATIYRRWSTSEALLCDVLRRCTPRPAWPAGLGDLVADVTAVLRSQIDGDLAHAPLALLSSMPFDDELRHAWFEGPGAAQVAAVTELCRRAKARGAAGTIGWAPPIRCAIESLRVQHLLYGPPADDDIRAAVHGVLLHLDPDGLHR